MCRSDINTQFNGRKQGRQNEIMSDALFPRCFRAILVKVTSTQMKADLKMMKKN